LFVSVSMPVEGVGDALPEKRQQQGAADEKVLGFWQMPGGGYEPEWAEEQSSAF
jgi:hypothetical protein